MDLQRNPSAEPPRLIHETRLQRWQDCQNSTVLIVHFQSDNVLVGGRPRQAGVLQLVDTPDGNDVENQQLTAASRT